MSASIAALVPVEIVAAAVSPCTVLRGVKAVASADNITVSMSKLVSTPRCATERRSANSWHFLPESNRTYPRYSFSRPVAAATVGDQNSVETPGNGVVGTVNSVWIGSAAISLWVPLIFVAVVTHPLRVITPTVRDPNRPMPAIPLPLLAQQES